MPENVTAKVFEELYKKLFSELEEDIDAFVTYIMDTPDIKTDDIETLLRNILEDALATIKDWIKKKYKIVDHYFRNFPSLDKLIYHEDGWTLHSAIIKHYEAYNKWRIKPNFINALLSILMTEIQRLPATTFDEIVRRTNMFEFVIIGGRAECGRRCSQHHGVYIVDQDDYTLPPYHKGFWRNHKWIPACKCSYMYCDEEDLDEEDLAELCEDYLDDWEE